MIDLHTERAEFERTLTNQGFPLHHLRKDRKGNYLRKNVNSAFQGWIMKASRVRGCND